MLFLLLDKLSNLKGILEMEIDRKNLVELDQWKNQKRNSDFSNYLKILSFNDLMNESDNLINQMKKSNEIEDLFSKTRLMMNEFSNRLEKRSKHLSNSVKDLKKSIEDRLH